MPETSKPEDLYCKAQTEPERLRLRTAVVAAYGGHVRAAARRLVPPRCMDDACQAGTVGLLDALDTYEPGRTGADRGAAFWAWAALRVRNAIQQWQNVGQFDCKAANRGLNEVDKTGQRRHRAEQRESVRLRRRHEPLDFEPIDSETPEHLTSMKESLCILSEMAAELSPEDRKLLFSEDGRNHRTGHYQSLVAKAAERLRGTDGPGRAVHGNSDTLRP